MISSTAESKLFNNYRISCISLIIFIAALTIPLVIYAGTMDDFTPKHLFTIDTIVKNGRMSGSLGITEIPGFYIYGAMIVNVLGIPPDSLLYLPIELIPMAAIFFLLIYKFSRNALVSSVITLLEMITGTNGSIHIYFFPHGIGYILFFMSITLIIYALTDTGLRLKEYGFSLVICGVAMIYISYDCMALFFVLLASVILLLIIYHFFYRYKLENGNRHLTLAVFLISILIILSLFEFGLFDFIYSIFIPTLISSGKITMSGLDKFLITYVSKDYVNTPLIELYLNNPMSITLIGLVKYGLLSLSISIFSIYAILLLYRKKALSMYDIMTASFVIMVVFYALLRIGIGGEFFTLIYYPGLICTVWIYKNRIKLRAIPILVLIVLLVLAPTYYYIKSNGHLVNSDEYNFSGLRWPANWYLKYDTGHNLVSDELTKNMILLYSGERARSSGDDNTFLYDRLNGYINIINIAEISYLINPVEVGFFTNDLALNYKLNAMSLEQWRIIKSWRFSADIINSNKNVINIYDDGNVTVLRPV